MRKIVTTINGKRTILRVSDRDAERFPQDKPVQQKKRTAKNKGASGDG